MWYYLHVYFVRLNIMCVAYVVEQFRITGSNKPIIRLCAVVYSIGLFSTTKTVLDRGHAGSTWTGCGPEPYHSACLITIVCRCTKLWPTISTRPSLTLDFQSWVMVMTRTCAKTLKLQRQQHLSRITNGCRYSMFLYDTYGGI